MNITTRIARAVTPAIAGTVIAACGAPARLPLSAGIGAHPELPAPKTSLIPLIKVADARGWPAGAQPTAAAGLRVAAFARGLDHPRWLYVLPNGDVLVAETNGPKRPKNNPGLKGWFTDQYQARAGSAVKSANRITLLRDADGDGIAEVHTTFLDNLSSPFGMTLVGDVLYVANSDALVRFPYTRGDTVIITTPTKVVDLPAGPINHHWTKNVIASADGSRLYVAVGSNSNAAERGIAAEAERAAIWEVDPATGAHRVFASGLRNPVGMAWVPATGALWVAVNERDELGSDLVPDFMTAVHDGGFYGFPFSYYGQHVDKRVKPQRPDLVAAAIVPDYALGAHTASLGLAWSGMNALPAPFANGMFVGQHGSWNRSPRSGYQVVFVPFAGGTPSGQPIPALTGFLDGKGRALGRPVGVAIDGRGALLVADDVGNTVWRVVAR
ncbi:MAG: PQQ-dependent sugar dehydrogenase [Gemmatimonadaceae bacterium]